MNIVSVLLIYSERGEPGTGGLKGDQGKEHKKNILFE